MALWARWIPVALALLGVSLAGADPQYDGQPARWLSDEVRAHPLATQMRSDYVTDRSRWGQVRVDGTMDWQGQGDPELARAVATQVEAYHGRWLARDEAALAELLHPDLLRVRNGTVTRGRSAALTQIAGETRGERPAGYPSSTELSIGPLRLQLESDHAVAVYRVASRSGARWAFADLATVAQVFLRRGDRWLLRYHLETHELADPAAAALPDTVPNQIDPFRFDFVYPVHDLARAVAFYTPLLGSPVQQSATHAWFRARDSFFVLTTRPAHPQAQVRAGKANGYGVIHVPDLEALAARLVATGSPYRGITACDAGRCIVGWDPSGNLLVFKQAQAASSQELLEPQVRWAREPIGLQVAAEQPGLWLANDADGLLRHANQHTLWLDDRAGLALGAEAAAGVLADHWQQLDRALDGLAGDLLLDELEHLNLAQTQAISYRMQLTQRENPRQNQNYLVLQLWSGSEQGSQLRLSVTLMLHEDHGVLASMSGLDYTAYPVVDLGLHGRYYKTLLGSEPYRDDNWLGFWSSSSVFGLVGAQARPDAWRPDPGHSNGYVDFTTGSAEAVFTYLQAHGRGFPVISAINGQAGIDMQPGYRQVVALDSEGNLVSFSEYSEY